MKKYNGLECVLLVDDDESTNFLHQLVIKKSGIDVFVQVVKNGQEALEFLTCTGKFTSEKNFPQPGIILLDVNMPLMNGWEFLEEYNKLPEQQKGEIVIVMVTSSLNVDDMEMAELDPNAKGFLSKPLQIGSLNNIIKENFKPI